MEYWHSNETSDTWGVMKPFQYDPIQPLEINWEHPDLEMRIPHFKHEVIDEICWKVRSAILIGTNGELDWIAPSCLPAYIEAIVPLTLSGMTRWICCVEFDTESGVIRNGCAAYPAETIRATRVYEDRSAPDWRPTPSDDEEYDPERELRQMKERCQKSGNALFSIRHEPPTGFPPTDPCYYIDILLNLKGDLSKYGKSTKQGPLYDAGPQLLMTEKRLVGRLEESEAVHETLVGVRFRMPHDYEQRAIEETTHFGYWLLKTLLPPEEVHEMVDDLPTFTISPEWIASMRGCLNSAFASNTEVAYAFYLRRQASGLVTSWRAQMIPSGVLWVIRDQNILLENRRADEDVLLFHRWITPGKSDPVPHLTEELWMVMDTKKRRKKDDREAFTQRQLVWMGH